MNELIQRPGGSRTSSDTRFVVGHAESRSCWDPNQLGLRGSILGRKWTLTIIASLHDGPVRHGQLCRRLKPVARKVLHQSLDGPVDDGLVEKIIDLDACGDQRRDRISFNLIRLAVGSRV